MRNRNTPNIPAPAIAHRDEGAAAVAVEHDAQRQQRVLAARLRIATKAISSTAPALSATIVSGALQPLVSALAKP